MDTLKRTMITFGTLGDSKVGKTALTNAYLEKEFEDEYLSTIGVNSCIKEITINLNNKELPIKVKIWDTAGQEKFKSISVQYIKNCMGIFIVYAINDIESFNNILSWLKEVEEKKSRSNIPLILIGNKYDLEKERKISKEEGEKLASRYNMKFFECSAKTGYNVNEAFQCLTDQVVETYKEEFIKGDQKTKIVSGKKKEISVNVKYYLF